MKRELFFDILNAPNFKSIDDVRNIFCLDDSRGFQKSVHFVSQDQVEMILCCLHVLVNAKSDEDMTG